MHGVVERKLWSDWFPSVKTLPSCTICESERTLALKENQVAYRGRRFSLYECLDCSVWFSPAEDFYLVANDDYQEVFLKAERQLAAERRFEIVETIDLKSFTKIVEIGCSLGDVLKMVRDRYPNATVCGLEDSLKMSEYVRERGLQCYSSAAEVPFKADLIYANHVFEHFKHPDDFFRILKTLGESSFEVRITFPNKDNFFIKKGLFPDLHLPQNRFYYSLEQVKKIFIKQGFEILEARTLEKNRFADNLRQCLYNLLREDLGLFKQVIESLSNSLEIKIKGENIRDIEHYIEAMDLGSEGLIQARKVKKTP